MTVRPSIPASRIARYCLALVLACAWGCGDKPARSEPNTVNTTSTDSWIEPDITSGKKPVRVMVTKTGWRSGAATLVLDQPNDVRRLYSSLAGNERLGFTCGYHWNVRFEYADASSESIDINEECETFRSDPAATWREVTAVLRQARERPTHFAIELVGTRNESGDSPASRLPDHFGFVVSTASNRWLLVSEQPWTESRIAELAATAKPWATVHPLPERDLG